MTLRPARLVAVALTAALLTGCGASDSPDTAPPDIAETPSDVGSGGLAASDTQPAAVALSFDGQAVPIATACTGADGAVLVTTVGEVTITLVREQGTALRYNGEGMIAESSQVAVEQVGASTVYRSTLQSDDVPAVAVALELGDTSALEECPA